MIRLRVNEASDSRLVNVRSDRALLGRLPECDVAIDDNGVSREHAEIFRASDGWTIRDLGSRNGTFVNDASIQCQHLRPGDRIRLGPDVQIEFLTDDAEDDSAAAPNTPRSVASQVRIDLLGWLMRTQWILHPRAAGATTIHVRGAVTIVGRDSEAGIQIQDESASRLHARLDRERETLAVVDLKSSNGTFVNDQAVLQAKLSTGDILRFGDVEFRVTCRRGPAWVRLGLAGLVIGAVIVGVSALSGVSDWFTERAAIRDSARRTQAQAIEDTRAGIEAARKGDAEIARAYLLHASDMLLLADLAPPGATLERPAEIFRDVISHLPPDEREFDFTRALDPATLEASQARIATLNNRDYVDYQLRRYAVELGQDPQVPRGFVDQVQSFVAAYERSPAGMRMLLRRARDIQPRIRAILASRHLPESFCYVAWVESGLIPTARSLPGAVGLWQLMPGTAKDLHLRVVPNDPRADERTDIDRSTAAAADYIATLLRDQGPEYFMLVLASYNRGPGAVGRAKQKVADPMLPAAHKYWYLVEHELLPKETRDYVPKIFATRLIAEAPERFGFEAP